MEISQNKLEDKDKDHGRTVIFTKFHEHQEGGDRGGTLQEDHIFCFLNNGETVTHEWGHDYPGEAADFGLDELDVSVLGTQKEAVDFVECEAERLRMKLPKKHNLVERD